MRRLFLVRHADTRIQDGVPAASWPLSERGGERARALAARIAPRGLECIYSSVEPKAIGTASELASVLEVPVRSIAGLHEHERSMVPLSSREAFEENIRRLFAEPAACTFGDESAEAAHIRFDEAVSPLIANSPDDLVVVTHGTVLTLFVAARCGVEPFQFWRNLGTPAAVTLTLPDFSLDAVVGVD